MRAREKRRFVEIVERMMNRWGYTHTDAKVYAHLLLSANPLTINDLSKLTGLSRSSISVALSKLTKDYLVNVKKVGKTKYFTPIPAFLERFLHQPKETLDKEVKPLKELTLSMLDDPESEEHRLKLESILKDLETLECILSKVIRLEKEETECLKELRKSTV
ncbi:GbsR/MarR family transcriptional regulator [Thermococcus waiotapuensis]|uniref:HTH-type transcriptional regulator n=1 Tax=Thermococcus waiotapuensis TaxID=90909 RepID=A0AAE4NVC2_9EURY|nr:helix-turn-helix domain-containing protein [Thermococcus waiotapuensis]MDV3103518.1 helix-turn-helix domain-containing protein [Thermococcus waiotapuensis]